MKAVTRLEKEFHGIRRYLGYQKLCEKAEALLKQPFLLYLFTTVIYHPC